MCGIAGIYSFQNNDGMGRDVRNMMRAMKHRGPNGEGCFEDQRVALGHVRLSIIDLSENGRQPMFSPDGRQILSYNGEIYNYLELKQELDSEYPFHTRTDTEVLLNAYRKWGLDSLTRFNGMFAFALYEANEGQLLLVRDRFGIKPLYYYVDNEKLIFASEIGPILKVLKNTPTTDKQSVYDFLEHSRTNHTERTFFKGIRKVPHGHYLKVDERGWKLERWYDLRENLVNRISTAEDFKEQFISSVRLRMRSDVPVGACLSGGLDSSSIVSVIQRFLGKTDLCTFSAVYGEGKRGDESHFINEYKQIVSNRHFVTPSETSLLSDIDDFVRTQEEPVPSTSAYAEYKIFELAKKHVTVTLSGQGADEALSGYLYFAGFYYKQLLGEGKWVRLITELICDIREHRKLDGIKGFIFFLLPRSLKERLFAIRNPILSDDFRAAFNADPSIVEGLYGAKTLRDSLLEHFEHKFEHHLIWGDRSSMRFSLETRFPFLDHNLVEGMLSLQNDLVLRKGVNKYILREAMKGILPEAIRVRRDKVGYETPEAEWFREKAFTRFLLDTIHSKSFRERGIFDLVRVQKLVSKHWRRKADLSKEIWKVLNLELWFQHYVDAKTQLEIPESSFNYESKTTEASL